MIRLVSMKGDNANMIFGQHPTGNLRY